MKIKLTITIAVDDVLFGLSEPESKELFYAEVLSDNSTLILHSNDIGDSVGMVTKIENITELP